jgi:hypothetical protein
VSSDASLKAEANLKLHHFKDQPFFKSFLSKSEGGISEDILLEVMQEFVVITNRNLDSTNSEYKRTMLGLRNRGHLMVLFDCIKEQFEGGEEFILKDIEARKSELAMFSIWDKKEE